MFKLLQSTNKLDNCIIEFQAFRGNNNEFIIKELVIVGVLSNDVWYYLFKPPYSITQLNKKANKINSWLSHHFHYIRWYEGSINYDNLQDILDHMGRQYSIIFTKGQEKAKFLQGFITKTVIDLSTSNICQKSFKEYNRTSNDINAKQLCTYVENPNHNITNCSLRNALILRAVTFDYIQQYRRRVSMWNPQSDVGTGRIENCGRGNKCIEGGVRGGRDGGGSAHKFSGSGTSNHSDRVHRTDNMTSNLQRLADLFNERSKSSSLATKKCTNLKVNKQYAVHAFKKTYSKHGEAILVDLGDSPYIKGAEPNFKMFLPKRFVDLLKDEDLQIISGGKFYLVSHGASGGNSVELTLHPYTLT